MKRNVSVLVAASVVAVLAVLASPAAASAPTQNVGERWAKTLDPGLDLPTPLVIQAANAAIAHGMTKGQLKTLFNYRPFAMAIGGVDQGFSALEAMSEHPEWIKSAYDLMRAGGGKYTISGTTSFQGALFGTVLDIRNPYLSDLGHMIAMGPAGYEVLVDVKTGRQVIGRGRLGQAITAPGGGPLKVVPPEEAAAAMWAAVGLAPDGVTPLNGNLGAQGPGFNTSTDNGSFSRMLYLFSGLALLLALGVPAARAVLSRRVEP